MDLRDISRINAQRANRWHAGFPDSVDGWTLADWSNAMCGEAGETANVVKKIRRSETGLRQAEQGDRSNADMRALLLPKLEIEIGDTAVYLDLLAQKAGLSLNRCIITTFNRVSVREGFPERLFEDW